MIKPLKSLSKWCFVLISFFVAAKAYADDTDRIRLAIDHIIATQLSSGLFAYDFDFLAGEPTGKNSLVRQAGTLFALGEYFVDTRDPRMESVLRVGLDRMAKLSLPTGQGRLQSVLEPLGLFWVQSGRLTRVFNRFGLLHTPEGTGRLIAGNKDYKTAHAGTTALTLISELEYFRATGDDRYAKIRQQWLEGLLSLHVQGRGIRKNPVTLWESPFFNGETWLALAYFHESFLKNTTIARELRALETYLMDLYELNPTQAFFQWGAMASAVRYRTTGEERFANFAANQVAWYLHNLPPEKTRKNSTCAMIEGLASVLVILQGRGDRPALIEQVRRRTMAELKRNRALQIQPNQKRLLLGGSTVLTSPALVRYTGAFLAGPYLPYTRTDINQHCVSAFSKVRRYKLFEKP